LGRSATSAFCVRVGRADPDDHVSVERWANMSTTRWQPLSVVWPEMHRLRETMEQWLGRAGGNDPRQFAGSVYPPLNAWEDDTNLYVEAELPELELTDLEILVNGDNQLSIKGDRKQLQAEKGIWHRQERAYGKFSRMGELPHYVESDKVTAEIKQGVLTITLPKRKEAKSRRVEVKSS
jgi:HSP20 family protein